MTASFTYLVRVDEVDIGCSMDNDIYLSAQIRVVLITHAHVHQANIPCKIT